MAGILAGTLYGSILANDPPSSPGPILHLREARGYRPRKIVFAIPDHSLGPPWILYPLAMDG